MSYINRLYLPENAIMMIKKERIFMIGYSMDKGGVESYVRNICEKLKDDFDIIYHWPVIVIDGKKWVLPRNRHNIFKYRRFWKRFFVENRFDVVYFNTCDIISIDILRFAKNAGIPVRIIHSHNTGNQFPRKGLWGVMHRIMEKLSRKSLDKFATDLLACSKSAGDWMFDGRPYSVIKNGIDISKYDFSESKNARIAASLEKISKPAIACLGRIEGQKNSFFSLEIFREVCWVDKEAQCLFIGDGADRKEIEGLVHEYGLSDRILFTGPVDNVNEWLSYVDCILMPSVFEGLPFALVEAQAAGIHSLVSDTVSREADITGLVEYKSLADTPRSWAERVLRLAQMPRICVSQKLAEAGFSINNTAETVKTIIKSRLSDEAR